MFWEFVSFSYFMMIYMASWTEYKPVKICYSCYQQLLCLHIIWLQLYLAPSMTSEAVKTAYTSMLMENWNLNYQQTLMLTKAFTIFARSGIHWPYPLSIILTAIKTIKITVSSICLILTNTISYKGIMNAYFCFNSQMASAFRTAISVYTLLSTAVTFIKCTMHIVVFIVTVTISYLCSKLAVWKKSLSYIKVQIFVLCLILDKY